MTRMENKNGLLPLIFVIVMTFAVYYESFGSSFIWDDFSFVVNNKAIRHFTPQKLLSYFTDLNASSNNVRLSRDVYRPLVTTSYAGDHALWGLNASFYHLENVVLHMANVVLVSILIELITGSFLAAFFASFIFALHPVQVEAVTWISGRSNVLFLLFYLSALIVHVRRSRVSSAPGFSLPLVFFTLALLSKEMAITLPLILFVYDLHFLPKKPFGRRLEYYIPFVLVAAFYLTARWAVVGGVVQGDRFWGGTIYENLLVTLKALAGYVRLLVLPVNLRVDYIVGLPTSAFEPDTAMALAILAPVLALYCILRRHKVVSFFVAWFFITLIPICNLVPFKAIMAERFLYLPSIAFAALVAFGLARARGNVRVLGGAFLAVLLLLYGVTTFSRNGDWRDEVTLFGRDLARSPESARLHYNLALAYLRQYAFGELRNKSPSQLLPYYTRAEEEFKEAIKMQPDIADAYLNLGNISGERGDRDRAMRYYERALAYGQEPNAYNNMGIIYYDKGFYDKAIACFKRALSYPDWAAPELGYMNMGNAYFMKKDYRRANEAWRQAVRRDPDNRMMVDSITAMRKAGV